MLVDSNVLLDIMTRDPSWYDWSSTTLSKYADKSILCINPIIYAEISIRFEYIEEVEMIISRDFIERLTIPYEAAFLAGKCFLAYRKRGGKRHSPLPDFFIGAHAAITSMPLITRDHRRYQTYFPKLKLISPTSAG